MKKRIGIIGGGIVGSTAAYYLARSGHDVTLFDDGHGQATKASAGIICPWFSLRRNKPWYFLVSSGAEFYSQLMADLKADGFETEAIYQVDGAILIRKNDKRVEKDLQMAQERRAASPSIGEVKALTPAEISERFPLIQTNKPATWIEGGGRVQGETLIQTLQEAFRQHGGKFIPKKAHLQINGDQVIVNDSSDHEYVFDQLLLTPGPHLPALLEPNGYNVDIRPQKGQLYIIHNEEWRKQHWPVVIPTGQSDIIPFNNGDLIIGATHEDDQGFDLEVDKQQLQALTQEAEKWLPSLSEHEIEAVKVGTRAHTSDYSVLLGEVPEMPNVWAISGLGSSGLTSGPFLGYQWSQLVQTGEWDIPVDDFPIEQYVTLRK